MWKVRPETGCVLFYLSSWKNDQMNPKSTFQWIFIMAFNIIHTQAHTHISHTHTHVHRFTHTDRFGCLIC